MSRINENVYHDHMGVEQSIVKGQLRSLEVKFVKILIIIFLSQLLIEIYPFGEIVYS